MLLAAPKVALAPLIGFSHKSVSVPSGSSDDLRELSVAPVGFNPSLESNNQSQYFWCPGLRSFQVCCLRIFVVKKLPTIFRFCRALALKYFLNAGGGLVSGFLLNRWKGSLFKLFQLFDCSETVRRRVYLLRGTRAPSAFYYICSGGFPGKCSASISVCKEILLSGQSNK